MQNEYQINPAFNKDLVFSFQPPPTIDISILPKLPDDWMDDLQKIICRTDDALPKDILNAHLGETSHYVAKKKLSNQLQLIYHRLQGNLDSELGTLLADDRKAIIVKLSEEIIYCTEGLHNRANIIVDSFHKAQNFAELLCVVRTNLVKEVAQKLSTEVHAQNHVELIAAYDGLGIKVNFPEDKYVGALTDISIRRALQQEFYHNFTPFHLPYLLINTFRELIPEFEIEKNHKDGLTGQTIEKITALIKCFLPAYINEKPNNPNYWQNYFKKNSDEDYFSIVNINFEKLYRSFYYALSNQNYLKNPQINTLLDCGYYDLFLRKKNSLSPKLLICKLLSEERHAELLEQLAELNARFPNYYKEECRITTTAHYRDRFINYLTQHLKISREYSQEIMLGFSLVIRFSLSKNNCYDIEKIAASFLIQNKAGFNLLMLGALNQPILINDIFSFFKAHKDILDDKIAEKMLLMKNKANLNALMIATMHHSDAVTMILDFIESHIQDLDNNLLQEFFLEKQANNYNVLMLAASKQAESTVTILGFLTTHISRFANDTLRKLFTQQQKDNYTTVTLTARDHPALLKNIFSFISNHIKFDREALGKLLFPENSNGTCTALMRAVANQVEAIDSILNFISANIENFNSEILEKIFLEKDQNGFTILTLAARYQPKTLELMLNFINKHYSYFYIKNIPELFLEKNQDNYNCLMLAAEFQPESVPIILNFIIKKIAIFKPHLEQILCNRNKKGYHSVMLACHHPEALRSIIYFINLQENAQILVIFKKLFFEKHESALTILMLAARHQPTSLKLILNCINKHYNYFYIENIPELFLEKDQNNYNCLMFATEFQPTSVPIILNFIIKRVAIFKPHLEQILFNRNKKGCHSVMLARHHPKALRSIIDFINLQTNAQTSVILKKLFFEKHEFGLTILMLAARDKAESLKILFELINKKIKIFPKENLRKLLFTKNELEYNCLMFAARNQLTAVAHILTFIQDQPKIFSRKFFTQFLLASEEDGVNVLMIAAQYQLTVVRFILNFIQEQPNIFSHEFLTQFLLASDRYGANVLMVAATYQLDIVELLLEILSKNIKHFSNEAIYQFVFKKISDKAASLVCESGIQKSVFSVTAKHARRQREKEVRSQEARDRDALMSEIEDNDSLENHIAITALLKFIDGHIDKLGIESLASLLTEKDNENYIFQTVCSENSFIMKNVLNFIATSINDNFITALLTHTELKSNSESKNIIQKILTNFVYAQLAQWPIETKEDKALFYKITTQCSPFLIQAFNAERFKDYSKNMDIIAKIQLRYLLQELEIKNAQEQEQPWYSRLINKLMSTTAQELAAARNLEKIVTKKTHNKKSDLNQLKSQHTEFQKPKLILSRLFVAFKKIEEPKADEAYEADREKTNWYFKVASPAFI